MRNTAPIAALAAACARHALLVVVLGLVLGALAGGVASKRLAVSTDVDTLFSARLPWKQREAERQRLFPQFTDLVVAVIDAADPEQAEATAAGLAAALRADPQHFKTVTRPDASPFFDTNGLLFLDTAQLSSLLDQTIDAQPFLGQLVTDPTARGLFAALSLVAMGVEHGQADLTSFQPALRAFHTTLASVIAGSPKPLSWERLLAGPAAELGGRYKVVLAQPVLNYGAVQPGGAATAALREAAARLEFVQSGAAHVRVTGSVALSDEEFATAAAGAVQGLIGSTVLVVLWLFLAVRSWRVIVPIVLTLLLGLLLTTGFAAIAVGTLNLISVAFAILFVGIAVDFAIQFSVRFRDMQQGRHDAVAAVEATAGRVGVQILVAALTTSAGFLAFVPTDFTGVAELGLIAGVGMLIAFACTTVFLPAALVLCRPKVARGEVGFVWAAPLDRGIARARWVIVAIFVGLGLLGALGLPRLNFDSDPLHTKDPNTEAMRTLADLIDDPVSNPYTIDILEPSVARAAQVGQRLQALPLVASTRTLQSLVPEDQPQKLSLIADAASLLAPTLSARSPAAPIAPADLRLAVQSALSQLAKAVARLPPDHPLAQITADLRTLQAAPDATLLQANTALTRFLPQQIVRLRQALSAQPVMLASIPPAIARDWVLPDGRARLQVVPKREAQDSAGLHRFVAQVEAVAPEAGGSAIEITATSDTVVSAFQHAALAAFLAIAIILLLVLRRVLDVALVLAPLLLSAALTVLVAVLLPLTLNFANIIALPLLLGVGVSFNIYFVMNWRAGEHSRLASPTARAVVFSALTTGTAFGSLALSRHPGTASMGVLLLLSLGCTLLSTLAFVPAMLALLPANPSVTKC